MDEPTKPTDPAKQPPAEVGGEQLDSGSEALAPSAAEAVNEGAGQVGGTLKDAAAVGTVDEDRPAGMEMQRQARLQFRDLEVNVPYRAVDEFRIHIGEQDDFERGKRLDIGSVKIPKDTNFVVTKHDDTAIFIRFDNGVELIVMQDCYPEDGIDVYY